MPKRRRTAGGAATAAAAPQPDPPAEPAAPAAERDAAAFLGSLTAMHAHVKAHGDIERRLDEGGGFVKIRNFMPEAVAEHALSTLAGFGEEEWGTDQGDCHHFGSISCDNVEGYENLMEIARPLWLMLPGRVPTFSAGRYGRGHHIARHTGAPPLLSPRARGRAPLTWWLCGADAGMVPVAAEDGTVTLYNREIASVWHLAKDWQPSYGGQLIDYQTGKEYNRAQPRPHLQPRQACAGADPDPDPVPVPPSACAHSGVQQPDRLPRPSAARGFPRHRQRPPAPLLDLRVVDD